MSKLMSLPAAYNGGLNVFYNYDENDERWELVVNLNGYYFENESGIMTDDCLIVDWYPY